MAQDNMVICYEGIQRIYRNAIVRIIRVALTTNFPNDHQEKLKAPFQKEWEIIKQNAHLSRISGDISSPISDDFDILSVNHFYNIFEKYYSLFFKDEGPLSDTEKKKRKQATLGWMKTIKDLRDPLSHPAEEAFSKEDSFILLDSARRVLLRLNLISEASSMHALIDRVIGSDADVMREPLEAQLPHREAIVLNFIGRERELSELWSWLEDPMSRRWALAGEGGKGKSALAYNFAIEAKTRAPEPFQAIFWLSAKKKRFLEGKTNITTPEFTSLETALARLLTYYGWREDINKPIDEKKQIILQLANDIPSLIIVDDIDSLESKDEDAIEFFSLDITHTRSKVLFTSRRTIFGLGATTTHVSGFTEDEAEQFISSRCQQMGLDQKLFDKATIKQIINVTEGSPLFIEDLMRLTASVRSIRDAIKIWEDRGGGLKQENMLLAENVNYYHLTQREF